MRAKLIALVFIGLLCGLAVSYDTWFEAPQVTATVTDAAVHYDSVPDVRFWTVTGQSYTLRTLPEKGIVLHFWASWCPPCEKEFPALLKQITAAHGQLALVAVSLDDNRAAMKAFIARQNFKTQAHVYWVWDADKALSLKTFNTTSPPETILIDTQRLMVNKIVGDPDWSRREMKQRLADLVQSKTAQ